MSKSKKTPTPKNEKPTETATPIAATPAPEHGGPPVPTDKAKRQASRDADALRDAREDVAVMRRSRDAVYKRAKQLQSTLADKDRRIAELLIEVQNFAERANLADSNARNLEARNRLLNAEVNALADERDEARTEAAAAIVTVKRLAREMPRRSREPSTRVVTYGTNPSADDGMAFMQTGTVAEKRS